MPISHRSRCLLHAIKYWNIYFHQSWSTVRQSCSPTARFSFSSSSKRPFGPLKSSLSPIFSLSIVCDILPSGYTCRFHWHLFSRTVRLWKVCWVSSSDLVLRIWWPCSTRSWYLETWYIFLQPNFTIIASCLAPIIIFHMFFYIHVLQCGTDLPWSAWSKFISRLISVRSQ